MFRVAAIALIALAFGLCCWVVVRDTRAPRSDQGDQGEQADADNSLGGRLRRSALEVWGKLNVSLEDLSGPEGAMTLSLRAVQGSCTEPPIRLFILYNYGVIGPVATITCHEADRSVSFEVRPYLETIRATFPMIPDHPDTEIEFGGTVTQMSRHPSRYKAAHFQSRQEIIDSLQGLRRDEQFGSPVAHKSGVQIYADPQDDRILVVETAACDTLGYRLVFFSFDGVSKTTMVKWTELGGTFLVCKGERDMGFISMQAATESLGLHPLNSIAQCVHHKTMSRCN